jgi:SAM-dependent methyltransferase
VTSVLYDELVPWYPLLDPAGAHAEEVAIYDAALEAAIDGPFRTLLELGAGAGNNGSHFKARRRCTLTDLSPRMLQLSRAQNPECVHVVGDMRTLRLGETFDGVLVHDAVVYMLDEQALAEAAATAFVHTRPGGAALFTPDCVQDSFREFGDDDSGALGTRSLRYTSWCWRPDPDAPQYRVDYAFLLRDGVSMRAVHETHLEGLFSVATWVRVLTEAGFAVEVVHRQLEELNDSGYCSETFLCRRPTTPAT